jgi:hypothetical protein
LNYQLTPKGAPKIYPKEREEEKSKAILRAPRKQYRELFGKYFRR